MNEIKLYIAHLQDENARLKHNVNYGLKMEKYYKDDINVGLKQEECYKVELMELKDEIKQMKSDFSNECLILNQELEDSREQLRIFKSLMG
jgi:hypothetical protein